MVQEPRELGAGEVGIEQQAGDSGHLGLQAALAEPLADAGRTAVLPDHRLVDRLAGRPVPEDHRLALVGDADGGDFLHSARGLLQGLTHHRDRGLVDLFRVVLNPAVLGVELRQRPPRLGEGAALGVEQDGAGAGGALVKRKQQRFGHGSDPSPVPSSAPRPRARCADKLV